MEFEELASRRCEWVRGSGKHPSVALCSRVRLARNFSDMPFPGRASAGQLEAAAERVVHAAGKTSVFLNTLWKKMQELDPLDIRFLLERHMISREFTGKPSGSVIIIGEEGIANIMVNEEDHLRIQVMKSGLEIADAWWVAESIESELGRQMDFAFSGEWGYLTACPTNVGTGLRASVMLHLPSLVISRKIVEVLSGVSKSDVTPRGAYGEGSEPSGDLFQLSNQVTLGRAESEIIGEIEHVARKVVEDEKSARDFLFNRDRKTLEDRVFRAYGILRHARKVSSAEALELLSHIKLGAGLGMLGLNGELINELIINTQPAHLQKLAGRELSRGERDLERADYIRKKLIEGGGKEVS